jgi:tRNA-dihydrouridine synthase
LKSGGAALIRQPDLAASAITAAKRAGLPVSVKTRLGYSYVDEWKDWLRHLLEQDIATLTIHLRTKKEMSKVPAHWELIPEIKALRDEVAPHTLLVINGDIRNKEEGEQLANKYGIDGVMIGRGIFTDPFCFTNHAPKTMPELVSLLHSHLDLYDRYTGLTLRPFETLKRFFKIYIRDFEGASDIREKLMHAKSTDEARAILRDL